MQNTLYFLIQKTKLKRPNHLGGRSAIFHVHFKNRHEFKINRQQMTRRPAKYILFYIKQA